jgi:hypothetical protein
MLRSSTTAGSARIRQDRSIAIVAPSGSANTVEAKIAPAR